MEYLPRQWDLTWEERFYTRDYQSIHSPALFCHTNTIILLCQRKALTNYSLLEQKAFWQTLREKSNRSEKVLELYKRWKKILPLVHLNTKQLICLLQDEINPLIEAYEHVVAELEAENLLNRAKRKIVDQTKLNIERIENLKQLIYFGLIERAKAYDILQAKRQTDDIVAALATEINALNLLETPIEIIKPFSENSDDNQRITIHDIVKELNKKEPDQRLLDEIKGAILGDDIEPLRTEDETKKDEDQFNAFIEKQKIKTKQHEWPEWVKTLPESFVFYINLGWQWRYFLYAILLTMVIQWTAALLPIGGKYLTYTLVLPWGVAFWQGLKDKFYHWKNQEIAESLAILRQSQRFISNCLIQTPLDLAHFDVDHFCERAKKNKAPLDKLSKRLVNLSIFEKWLLPESLRNQIKEIVQGLSQQQEKIKQGLHAIAEHIADRMGDEIEERALQPVGLEKWRQYVKHYGNEAVISVFEKNADIILRWGDKIPGVYLQKETITKWESLIKTWVFDQEKQQACLRLHFLLKGKITLSREDFQKAIEILALKPAHVVNIQETLYQTLSGRDPQTAALLTPERQAVICDWRQANLIAIKKAHEIMEAVLAQRGDIHYDEQQLQQCHTLLDGEDFYDAIQSNYEKGAKRNNRVRQFFEEYDGQSNDVFPLLLFMPISERKKAAKKIKNKRLAWFEQHGGIPSKLTDEDEVLLKNEWVFQEKEEDKDARKYNSIRNGV